MYKLYKLTKSLNWKLLGSYDTDEARYAAAKKHGWFSDLEDDDRVFLIVDPDGFEGEMWPR